MILLLFSFNCRVVANGITVVTLRNSLSCSPFDPRPAVAGLVLLAGAGTSAAADRIAAHGAASSTAVAASVTNCNDAGAGSLRAAVATHAAVIDMTTLACSTITLSTGAIIVDHEVPDVTFKGPTGHGLSIDANHNGRVLVHNGEGMLTLDHLTLTNGSYVNFYYGGGCVYAFGSVTLQNSTISNCLLSFGSFAAKGGGIYVKRDLTLNDSVLSGNQALAASKALGGAAYVHGNLVVDRSTIRDNSSFTNHTGAMAGGIYVRGQAQVYGTTISGNLSEFAAGIMVRSNSTISNSTLSGNAASFTTGGIFALGPLLLDNSTVAFNTQSSTEFGAGIYANAGVVAHSSIIANNTSTASGQARDLYCRNCLPNGSKNLIMGSSSAVPGDTIVADPILGPLADNGGQTKTHALLTGSPALEAGSNIRDLPFDQRGRDRTSGTTADIGAYESGDDLIFADSFD